MIKIKLEIFKDKNKKCRIRLRARNGRILMSSEAYKSKRNAMDTAESICDYAELKYSFIKDLTE